MSFYYTFPNQKNFSLFNQTNHPLLPPLLERKEGQNKEIENLIASVLNQILQEDKILEEEEIKNPEQSTKTVTKEIPASVLNKNIRQDGKVPHNVTQWREKLSS